MKTSKYVMVGGAVFQVESAGLVESPESHTAGSILRWLAMSALVVLLTVGPHQVLGAIFDTEAEVTSEEADFEPLPPVYAFRAIDFDDAVEGY